MFASRLIENLPEATLSAILIYIAIRIFHVDEMRAMRRYSWRAYGLMLTAMFGVVILGVGYGSHSRFSSPCSTGRGGPLAPNCCALGRTPDGLWVPHEADDSQELPGVLVFRLNGPSGSATRTGSVRSCLLLFQKVRTARSGRTRYHRRR